ncbi:hypothetical protein [Streptosporangium sp. NPDC002524]
MTMPLGGTPDTGGGTTGGPDGGLGPFVLDRRLTPAAAVRSAGRGGRRG